uniref:Uncharacterized protein n=1 Tax=Glossina palpalis gambiensis TaxID=67801 RepID=A0A1B0C1M3_9MUSC
MACCMKSSKKDDHPCCTDVRRCCFGKNHDAFFCYNYEKAKNCQSPWHPRRPDVYYVPSRFDKPVEVEEPKQPESGSRYYQPEPYRTELNKFESYDSIPRRVVETDDRQVCYCGHRSKKGKKKTPGLKVAREYLQRCLLQRLTVGWTDEDDRRLNDCIYHQLAKIKGPDHVIEVLDEMSAQKKMEPVFRSWMNQLKQVYSRPRAGDNSFTNLDKNCATRSISAKFLHSSEDTFSTIPYPVGGKQYHIAGATEKFKESLVYNSTGSGKLPKTRKYHPEEEEYIESIALNLPDAGKFPEERNYNQGGKGARFDNSCNYNLPAKAGLSQNKRVHLDTVPSDEFAHSDKNDSYYGAYQGNGCNENTYNGFVHAYIGSRDQNSKSGKIEQSYLGPERGQLVRGDGYEHLCSSHKGNRYRNR